MTDFAQAPAPGDLIERFRVRHGGRARKAILREAAAASADMSVLVGLGLVDEDDADVRALAAFYAGDRGVIGAVPRLVAIAEDTNEELAVRRQAFLALEQLGHADPALQQSMPRRIRREAERVRPGATPSLRGSWQWQARIVAGVTVPLALGIALLRLIPDHLEDRLYLGGLVVIGVLFIFASLWPDDE